MLIYSFMFMHISYIYIYINASISAELYARWCVRRLAEIWLRGEKCHPPTFCFERWVNRFRGGKKGDLAAKYESARRRFAAPEKT